VQFRVTGATQGSANPFGAANRKISPSQNSGNDDSQHISLGRVTIDKEKLFEEQSEALGFVSLFAL
jgi:hypothetical protein